MAVTPAFWFLGSDTAMSKAARTTTSKRETSAYETPTDEKRAFGARMREAREIAGMTITEAAESMGYSQPVQLSLMETGIRMPTLRVIVACATLYGTTMDFLAGFVPDSDRDPAAALQRHVASRIAAEFQRLGRQMSVMSVDVVRELMPNAADGQRLACLVLEVSSSLATYRARNPGFDDTRA